MKIKEGFVLREVMGNYVVVAIGEASRNFRGMIKLNATAADIWNCISRGMDEAGIYDALFDKYEVGPGSMGTPEFVIEKDVIGDILRKEFENVM